MSSNWSSALCLVIGAVLWALKVEGSCPQKLPTYGCEQATQLNSGGSYCKFHQHLQSTSLGRRSSCRYLKLR